MRMSRTQVEEACERIEKRLSDPGREAHPTDVLPLAHAAADLRQLRDAYSADPAAELPCGRPGGYGQQQLAWLQVRVTSRS